MLLSSQVGAPPAAGRPPALEPPVALEPPALDPPVALEPPALDPPEPDPPTTVASPDPLEPPSAREPPKLELPPAPVPPSMLPAPPASESQLNVHARLPPGNQAGRHVQPSQVMPVTAHSSPAATVAGQVPHTHAADTC